MVNQAYISAITANIIAFVTGTSICWPSPILPKLSASDVNDIPFGRRLTDEENSWIGSLLSLGAVFGPFIYGYLADKIGRKLTLISIGVPFLVAYLILAFAEIVELYYVARFISGVAMGGVFTVTPMYLGEIAEDKNRGALGSAMNVLMTFGLLFTYSVGPYASIMTFNIILAIFPAVFMILFFIIAPESPHYHIAKGNYKAAGQCLDRLRGSTKNSDELEDIKRRIEQSRKATIADLFRSKGLIKAFIICLALVAFQQLSGIGAVLSYAQIIFNASGGNIPSEISSIIVGSVLVGTSFVTPLFVDRLGRKILLYASAGGMLTAEILLGLYFYLKDHENNVDAISWLPTVSLVIYIVTYNFGFGALPWAIMAELYPSSVKSIASALTSAFCWILSFIITKFFNQVVDGIGMGPCFWLFAAFCALALVFTIFYVIETKGKSLQEIQDILDS